MAGRHGGRGFRSAHSLTLWGCWTYTPAHWAETGAQARGRGRATQQSPRETSS